MSYIHRDVTAGLCLCRSGKGGRDFFSLCGSLWCCLWKWWWKAFLDNCWRRCDFIFGPRSKFFGYRCTWFRISQCVIGFLGSVTFSSPPNHLSPSVFRTWQIFCLLGRFNCVVFCWSRRLCSLLWSFHRTDFWNVVDLLTISAVRLPALYHHYHLSIFMIDSIRDGLKAFSVKADSEHLVSMHRPSGRSHLRYVLGAAVHTEERSHNFSCNGCWEITNCHTDPTRILRIPVMTGRTW